MSDFKIGQKVWAMAYGWGRVISIDEDNVTYPIYIEFDSGRGADFTCDGKYSSDEMRILFFKEIEIPEDALVPPVEETILNTGDIVALNDGRIVYVESYSSETNKVFFCHNKIPRNFEEAFGPTSVQKSLIRKVMGNLNA